MQLSDRAAHLFGRPHALQVTIDGRVIAPPSDSLGPAAVTPFTEGSAAAPAGPAAAGWAGDSVEVISSELR